MSKGWTEERRRRQAETIRKNKPWEKSTGPKTSEGKARSSMNAYKHGTRCRIFDEYRRLLWLNQEFLKQCEVTALADLETAKRTNKLKDNPKKRS